MPHDDSYDIRADLEGALAADELESDVSSGLDDLAADDPSEPDDQAASEPRGEIIDLDRNESRTDEGGWAPRSYAVRSTRVAG